MQSARLYPEIRCVLFRYYSNHAHHSSVFMLEQMAVINERADRVWIAEVHSQLHAWICSALAVPIGDIDRIAQERLIQWHAVPFHKHEMDLMDMERVEFLRPVFDDPVLDVSLLYLDIRIHVVRIE